MLNYIKFINKTLPKIIKYAKPVKASVRFGQHKYDTKVYDDEVYQVVTNAVDNSSHGSGRKHTQVIRFIGEQSKKSEMWVSCTCEYWLYHNEYAVWVNDSTSIIHCNGNFPKEKNRILRPGLCKHLVKAIPVAAKARTKEVKAFSSLAWLGFKVKKP